MHDESLLTPKQVSEWFAERGMTISVVRIAEGIREGSIPGYKVGRWYVTPLPWLRKWLYGPGNDPDAALPVETPSPVVIPFVGRKQAAS